MLLLSTAHWFNRIHYSFFSSFLLFFSLSTVYLFSNSECLLPVLQQLAPHVWQFVASACLNIKSHSIIYTHEAHMLHTSIGYGITNLKCFLFLFFSTQKYILADTMNPNLRCTPTYSTALLARLVCTTLYVCKRFSIIEL